MRSSQADGVCSWHRVVVRYSTPHRCRPLRTDAERILNAVRFGLQAFGLRVDLPIAIGRERIVGPHVVVQKPENIELLAVDLEQQLDFGGLVVIAQ